MTRTELEAKVVDAIMLEREALRAIVQAGVKGTDADELNTMLEALEDGTFLTYTMSELEE